MNRPVVFLPRAPKPDSGSRFVAVVAACLLFMLDAALVNADAAPARAKDPAYGWVLYNYHQGEALKALTLLEVARERGGIRGHGAYPELVKGGLMLSYGMPREARDLFARLLKETKDTDAQSGRNERGVGERGANSGVTLVPGIRSQAWFYLGKVFYLEGDYPQAHENFQKVDGPVLEESDSELYAEWLYLRARLAMLSDSYNSSYASSDESPRENLSNNSNGETLVEHLRARLKHSGVWAHYLSYNIAMAEVTDGDVEKAQQSLRELISRMEGETPADDRDSEYRALLDKSRLSLARLHLREARFADALRLLSAMPLNGVFSDTALYDYAVAAAEQGQLQRALDALEALSQRTLFLSWREQVPYARGYVLEQLNQPRKALNAFVQASEHYESRGRELVAARQSLTEENLMARLSFLRNNDEIATDAYGRLRVMPSDFGISDVLATEPFQQALSELNELYQMQTLLTQREDQFSTFETMLETRRAQRERRSREARFELEQQQADEWVEQQHSFRAEIDAAIAIDDFDFFMTSKQKTLKARLDRVAATLAQLPEGSLGDGKSVERQRTNYARMKAYFDWTLANDYGVNRWAAQKQLRELNAEMQQFENQRAAIDALVAGDEKHDELAGRLIRKGDDIQSLKAQVQEAIAQARNILMGRLDKALEQQGRELQRYLVASRHAQARLADQLFRAGQSTEAADE
ncbi:tetratricopeptide repeat protein [Marinobacter salexigens]